MSQCATERKVCPRRSLMEDNKPAHLLLLYDDYLVTQLCLINTAVTRGGKEVHSRGGGGSARTNPYQKANRLGQGPKSGPRWCDIHTTSVLNAAEMHTGGGAVLGNPEGSPARRHSRKIDLK